MNTDQYFEILNGRETFEEIAYLLISNSRPLMIGWTDGAGSHFEIMFVTQPLKLQGNQWQGGLRTTDLFVSIMGVGSFGFEYDEHYKKHPYYFSEKLDRHGVLGNGVTLVALAELLNGVMESLHKSMPEKQAEII